MELEEREVQYMGGEGGKRIVEYLKVRKERRREEEKKRKSDRRIQTGEQKSGRSDNE